MITAKRVTEVHSSYGVDINDRDAKLTANQCNLVAGDRGRTAEAWLHHYAHQAANDQRIDGLESKRDHVAMYGTD